MKQRLFRPEHLTRVTTDVFVAAGWSMGDALEVARHFVLANLSGHDSHGIGMLPLYIKSAQDGLLSPQNQPVDRICAAPFLVVDGQIALGQPTAHRAVARAATMAEANGIAVLNLVDAHHIGRLGHYAEQAADRGLVSFFWVNVAGRPPMVAAHGGKTGTWGTNPQATGIPSPDGKHLVLDFATSRMALGKARVALNKGVQAAEGYLIDSEGEPTTDPSVVFPPAPMGALLPFGDHKGAGLSFMAEILSAGLGNGALIKDKPHKSWIINSLFGILFDPKRLDTDSHAQAARVAAITDYVRAAVPKDVSQSVKAPGDVEREMRLVRSRDGIPLDAETWEQIVTAAAFYGIDAEKL
jgi:hydroxycarboxylate dehydrogenase B